MMPDGWYGVAAPSELILKFLGVFSRFEYALKVTGFLEGKKRDPKPAWDGFAREVSTGFDLERERDGEFKEAVQYLLDNPPKKLVLTEDRLVWQVAPPQDVSGSKNALNALRMVRRVRNNLFHGGKYLLDNEASPDRDQRLIKSSLTVLCRCVKLVNNVRHAYEE